MRFNALSLLALSVSALATAPALAQDAGATETILLDEIVLYVTGGFTPVEAAEYGRAASVITAEDIAAQGITTVQDALRAVPGVSVASSGGSFTELRIRGAEANHAKIMIDGMPLRGGGNNYLLSGLSAENIERIEVLRGPQSVFYGSTAASGVVNIITKSGEPGQHASIRAEAGAGHLVSGQVSTRNAQGGVTLSFTDHDDEGWDYSGSDGEKDGIHRREVQIKADYALGEALRVGATLRRATEDYAYDGNNYMATDAAGYVVDRTDLTSEVTEDAAQIWAEFAQPGGRISHRLSYARVDHDQALGSYATTGRTHETKYLASIGLDGAVEGAAHILNVMAEDTREENGNSYSDVLERNTRSVAAEYRGAMANGVSVQAGLRRDWTDTARDFTSWNIGTAWESTTGLRVHASAGRGMAFPSFIETFGFPGYSVPNLDLAPEINQGFDIGVGGEFAQGRGSYDLTYFNEEITDLIGMGSCGGQPCSVNAQGDSRRQGVELSARYDLGTGVTAGMDYTYLDFKTDDATVTIRRPRHELGATLAYVAPDDKYSASATLRHVSGAKDRRNFGDYQVAELPSYTTLDLAGQVEIAPDVALTARVENALDATTMDSWGYEGRGRTAWVGLSAKW